MTTSRRLDSSAPRRPASPLPAGVFVLACAVVAAALASYGGVLAYGFSQDDYAGLARARGLMPALETPWRWLSQQAFFTAWHAGFALDPWPYHAASLALHALCALLVFAWIARWVAPWAAAIGAAFFATHPTAYTAVHWVAAIGDPMALFFALLALHLAVRRDALRGLALPAFAASLVSKESTLLLPGVLLVLLVAPDAEGTGRARPSRATTLALVVLAVAYGGWLALLGGSATDRAAGAAYATGLGTHVGFHLLNYAGWQLEMISPLVHTFSDVPDPAAVAPGAALIVGWLLGLADPGLRRRGWLVAGAHFILLLAPVLLLRHHVYHYYAYAALPGVALALAALLERLVDLGRRRAGSPRWALAAALAMIALLALNGGSLVRRIEHAPLGAWPLRAEPIVDRALVAQRIVTGVARSQPGDFTRLYLWTPARLREDGSIEPTPGYPELNARAATMEGLALRVHFPSLVEAAFVPELVPVGPDTRYGIFALDGRTDVFTWSTLDSILRAPGGDP